MLSQSKLVTIRKELAKQRELLQTRKSRKTGKRVKLKGRFVFSTTEVLEIAREAGEATAAKKGRERLRKRSISVEMRRMRRACLRLYLAILRAIALL